MTEIVEGELVAEHEERLPAVREPAASPTLFGTDDPAEVVERATAAAKPLADVVRRQGLAVTIQGREHVKVEGWTLLGSMLGVFPVVTWTRKMENGWEARCEARTRDGAVVGAAEAECTRDENQWSLEPTGRNGQKLTARDDYALRSMAQTRSTSKALRMPLGFVMQLAGFDATPADEMPAAPETPRVPDPHGLASERADNVPSGATVIHFGKNKGKRLAELSSRQLAWYASEWTPNPDYASVQDAALKAAAQQLAGAPPQPPDDTDGIPF